jgi:hypothetical protein
MHAIICTGGPQFSAATFGMHCSAMAPLMTSACKTKAATINQDGYVA